MQLANAFCGYLEMAVTVNPSSVFQGRPSVRPFFGAQPILLALSQLEAAALLVSPPRRTAARTSFSRVAGPRLNRGGINCDSHFQVTANAFASCICRGVRHSGSKSFGQPTKMTVVIALDVATFSRFKLYKNSIPRGRIFRDDVVSE